MQELTSSNLLISLILLAVPVLFVLRARNEKRVMVIAIMVYFFVFVVDRYLSPLLWGHSLSPVTSSFTFYTFNSVMLWLFYLLARKAYFNKAKLSH